MKVVGLTGGIGSGKSTVLTLLAQRGAHVVDADAIVRQLQAPGMPVFEAMVRRFGAGIVAADGTLDRPAVARIVFGDPEALADLNAIVHPAVREEIDRQVAAHEGTDDVVVLDIPLLTERRGSEQPLAAVVVVDVPVETQVERLVRFRGFDEADAWARIAQQATREERLATADRVVDNSGDAAQLDAQVAELWEWIGRLPSVS